MTNIGPKKGEVKMKFRKILISTIAALSFGASTPIAFAQDTIVIGEINHYKRMAAFAGPYKQGLEMAV